mgnify:CR=1 FL=1
MKKAEEVLKANIAVYNSEVNDMSKFAFSKKELKMFTGIMDEYAKIKAIDFVDWIAKKNYITTTNGAWLKVNHNEPMDTKKHSTMTLYKKFIQSI